MSLIDDVLSRSDDIKALAEKVGLDPGDVKTAAEKLVPHIQTGIRRLFDDNEPAANPTWFADIVTAANDRVGKGESISVEALAGPDADAAVKEVAAGTGIDAGALSRLMPELTARVVGDIERKSAASSATDGAMNSDGSVDWKNALNSDDVAAFVKNLL